MIRFLYAKYYKKTGATKRICISFQVQGNYSGFQLAQLVKSLMVE